MTPDQILALRCILGLTQKALAAKLGVHLRTYQQWEYGRRGKSGLRRPTLALFLNLMEREGIALSDLEPKEKK